jgi:hypothetical protein
MRRLRLNFRVETLALADRLVLHRGLSQVALKEGSRIPLALVTG